MKEDGAEIHCIIFQKQEPNINALTDRINATREFGAKAAYADKLKEDVGLLLKCAEYDCMRLDCKNCHTIAKLSKAAAELIIKAQKLERKKD